MALPTPLLISLILLPSPSTANEGNILATGDILPTDGQLSYKDAAFVIQDDCNLVLYTDELPNGFQSATNGLGTNCTLTLSDHGQLLIKNGQGLELWSSPGGTKKGKYVAVLGPDGVLNVFGPSVWSTPRYSSPSAIIDGELNDSPLVRNVLFSSQFLMNENSKLTSRDYTLEITEDCNLEFRKASVGVVWQSETKGKGKHCLVSLTIAEGLQWLMTGTRFCGGASRRGSTEIMFLLFR
ncbi:mannose-specific lectin 2-like [Dendrobium catenatum]|uniref:Mannose-specific lectin 2 n=1 Tax=Dendrobium catenatum TaxID=906689 RepID=A0A2I0VBH6_9ASPA|nr:mannose-specific lectin 2-like [Dendrobium catenatum]PKU60762.1 Mannose-specific lectin 2 [Dendrobium catenatum]